METPSPPAAGSRYAIRVFWLYAGLAAANLAVWSCAFVMFRAYPVLLGSAFLAYSLGLRHAVDADHIAAIDNVTRKLMQEGKRPITTGLFFSLGHSSVVFLASIAIAFTASALKHKFAAFQDMGVLVGTGISALFLFAIASVNIVILASVTRMFRRARAGEKVMEADLALMLRGGGLMAHLFRRAFALIRANWQMYPLGFLFGLGFDTATEIGVLGISAAGAAQGLSIWAILIFPALFAAGMTLIDTTDTVLMVGAYGWAFVNPVRKLYYNMTITFVSVLVALAVGGIEALGLIGSRLGFAGGIWGAVAALNRNFTALGFVIIGIFVVSWALSIAVYRLRGYDRSKAETI